jgi:hypothetical protein
MDETHNLHAGADQARSTNQRTLTFNSVLSAAGIPSGDVLLMRHQDGRSTKGRTPFRLWRDSPVHFEIYQSHQRIDRRQNLNRPYWASFVGTPKNETLFVGLYRMKGFHPNEAELIEPHNDEVKPAGTVNVFNLSLASELSDLIGLLYIDWGPGQRAWIQLAENHEKPIVELQRELREPDFPGYAAFMAALSEIESLPQNWATVLAVARGVYLITCPRTLEQYVGAAVGESGFLGRWWDYARTGHGGNVALKSREPSDYSVSILEVAGSAATVDEILALEARWKAKLKTR